MYFSTVSFLSIFVLVATSVAFAQHPNTKFQSYYVEGACECVDITLDDGNSGENQIKRVISTINFIFRKACWELPHSFQWRLFLLCDINKVVLVTDLKGFFI